VPPRHRTATASAFRTRGKSSRVNKIQVIGYFSADLSRALRQIALDEGTSLQALIGEAVDLLLKLASVTAPSLACGGLLPTGPQAMAAMKSNNPTPVAMRNLIMVAHARAVAGFLRHCQVLVKAVRAFYRGCPLDIFAQPSCEGK
jgi:hypothetical protein